LGLRACLRSSNNGNKIVLKIDSQKVIENEDPYLLRVSIKYVTALKIFKGKKYII